MKPLVTRRSQRAVVEQQERNSDATWSQSRRDQAQEKTAIRHDLSIIKQVCIVHQVFSVRRTQGRIGKAPPPPYEAGECAYE